MGAAFIEAYLAASQSGKSTLVKQRLARLRELPRWLVWDFKREYGADVGALAATIATVCDAAKARRYRIVFRPSFDEKIRRQQFEWFCRVAYASVTEDHIPCLLVVEELAFVTTPAWSPPGWTQATCTGMGLGLSVIGTSQHPAQIDKNFFGNTTAIYCGRLTEPAHVAKMAGVLGVAAERIANLPPYRFLHRAVTDPRNISELAVKKPRGRPA